MKDRLMNMVKVGEKGQIVIPKEIREMMGIAPGDVLLILADTGRGIAIPRKSDMDRIYGAIIDREEKSDAEER